MDVIRKGVDLKLERPRDVPDSRARRLQEGGREGGTDGLEGREEGGLGVGREEGGRDGLRIGREEGRRR